MNTLGTKYFAAAALLGATLLPLAAHADSINQRLRDQHRRIHQGVESGQITRGERSRLDRRDAAIHRQERRDRLANGGRLTPAERERLQARLNHSSQRVYRDKHNGLVR